MRKVFLIIGLVFAAASSFAQKIDDVKADVKNAKYADAKTKIDQMLADPKNASNAEALYYKAVVYHNLARQNSDPATAATALDAMKAYLKMEDSKPEGQKAMLSMLENHKTIFEIYQDYYKQGADNFQKKDYATAYNNFEKALDAFDAMSKRNIVQVKFDTTTNLYAGYSAQNAKMYNEAAKYYDKLIGMNIGDSTYIDMYRFMINNNLENKDTAGAKKYLALSQTKFPNHQDLWLDYQTLFLSNDKSKRYDEYDALVKANPKNESLALNYAIELYNNLRANEASEKDPAQRQRVEAALKNVLTINPNATTANLLLAQFYWTELYQVQTDLDAVKGNAPASLAKRKELNAKMDGVFDKVFPYLQKSTDLYGAQATLKAQDKANYRIVLGQLADYYNHKKQPDKATAYQQKQKALQ